MSTKSDRVKCGQIFVFSRTRFRRILLTMYPEEKVEVILKICDKGITEVNLDEMFNDSNKVYEFLQGLGAVLKGEKVL